MQQLSGSVKRNARYGIVLAIGTMMIVGSVIWAPALSTAAGGLDTTTLVLDRDGADVAGGEPQIAKAAGTARKYIRPADRPESGFGDETSLEPHVFHRPTDNRSGL